MLDRVIRQAELMALIDELAREWRVIGPVQRSEPGCDPPTRHFYEEVDRAERLDLGFRYAVYSPKRFLLPPEETLFTFRKQDGGFHAEPLVDRRPMALVGVHPCDVHAIATLDKAFTRDMRDEHYLARRESTFIIGVDCAEPCTHGVFCADMQTNAAESGYDVMLFPIELAGQERRYGVLFGTERGREWLLYSRRGARATVDDERAMDQYRKQKAAAFQPALSTKLDELPNVMDRSYDSLLWEATARRCYSCGSCNLVCPTCFCFNVFDEPNLDLASGSRRREWDGCQLREFALVAGDHNFRPKSSARLRHRIYRKAKWINERTEGHGCVGCARCDRACTAKINSVEIYNQLAEEV